MESWRAFRACSDTRSTGPRERLLAARQNVRARANSASTNRSWAARVLITADESYRPLRGIEGLLNDAGGGKEGTGCDSAHFKRIEIQAFI